MVQNRRIRCPECGYLGAIKNGRKLGHQRYYCKNCNSYFTRKRKDVSTLNRFVWFERWILGKQTIRQIVRQSGYSEKSLRRWFDDYLRHYPQWEIRRSEKLNLMIDGTYFENKLCLVLYRDNNVKATIMYRLTDGEWEEELREDLENILSLGIEIESVTTDGARNIIKAVNRACPTAKVQRCVIHIQRECLIWLTRHPKSDAGVELRRIVRVLHLIESKQQWGEWMVSLMRWHERHKEYIETKSRKAESDSYWFTHKMVRRAFVHIRRALPDMFHYLDNPDIPKSTNSLEAFFGHLKQNISLHRGLSKEHYRNYVKWYLYFRNKDIKEIKASGNATKK
jgi:transposase-like protein